MSIIQDYEQHILKALHGKKFPSKILYLDTEAEGVKRGSMTLQKMTMAWTCLVVYNKVAQAVKETWRFHTDNLALHQYIQSCARRTEKLYLFGHNIYYDLQVSGFFKYFSAWKWKRTFFYESGLTFCLSLVKGEREIVCLSTTNYFPASLKVLGDTIGFPKLDVDVLNLPEDLGCIYCFRDVEILVEIMQQYLSFLYKNDLGSFAMTRASQAMKAYRHRFMSTEICIHTDEEIIELERKAYFGGRVECFRIGNCGTGDFMSLDINSMYPYVMVNKAMPTRLVDYQKKYNLSRLPKLLEKHLAIARVVIATEEPAYAIRREHKTIFPIGTFECYLCTEGLKRALKHGAILEIKEIATYESGFIFTEYIEWFYKKRLSYKETKKGVFDTFCKYMMNSLYGKFGQMKPVTEEEYDEDNCPFYREEISCASTGEHEILTKLLNVVTIEFGTRPASLSMYAIPSHITEYARIMLWEIMTEIGFPGVLYCDTDSIKIPVSLLSKVKHEIDDKKLGALKIEETARPLFLYGPKDYIHGKKIVRKGVPHNALETDTATFSFDMFLSMKGHLRAKVSEGYLLRRTSKKLKRVYDKGTVLPDGTVRPYRFPLIS